MGKCRDVTKGVLLICFIKIMYAKDIIVQKQLLDEVLVLVQRWFGRKMRMVWTSVGMS